VKQQVLNTAGANRSPEDFEQLLRAQNQLIEQQSRQIRQLVKRISELAHELAALKGQSQARQLELEIERLNAELKKLSGHASERRPSKKNEKAKAPRVGHGPKAQPKLAKESVKVTLDEADKVCPECGDTLIEWEGQAETRVQIDIVPARYVLREYQLQKYRCACCRHIESAELSLQQRPLKAGGRYSVDFALHVAADKYLDHAPLERQVRRMARHGLTVGSATLWDQISALAQLAKPTWLALAAEILKNDVIGMDQTGWPYLRGRKGKRDNFQMWSLASHDAVYYTIEERKDSETATRLLKDYAGRIVCDDFSTHAAAAREGAFKLSACMAHVRRRFHECDSPKATPILNWIAELYQIESEVGPQSDRSKDELRRQRRDTKSRVIMKEIREYMNSQVVSPKTAFGGALLHAIKKWPQLEAMLDDPQIWIDNNLTERSLRGPVVGRRNHFGSKSKDGAEVASIFYSLFETAKLNQLDPIDYVRRVVLNARENPEAVTLPSDLLNARENPEAVTLPSGLLN